MTERTQEWAERVWREAVGLGFHDWEVANCYSVGTPMLRADTTLPDFRDRLTELACIAWVEDVARERRLSGASVDVHLWPDGSARVMGGGFDSWRATTLAEACIAAVPAMKGGE